MSTSTRWPNATLARIGIRSVAAEAEPSVASTVHAASIGRMPAMKFGLFDINQGACLDPSVLLRTAQQAEAAGLESLWAGEHVVLPDPRVPPSPMEPTEPILDPVIALTYAAAVTR